MMSCPVQYWSRSYAAPAPALGISAPGSVLAFELEAQDIDCSNTGVTITNVQATIEDETDDGLLTLGVVTTSGNVITVPHTADPDPTHRRYAVKLEVDTSDNRKRFYWQWVEVKATNIAVH